MKRILISGNFDPFTDAHLDYFEQAEALRTRRPYPGHLTCIVSSDKQVLLKKGKVNIPENSRQKIVHYILNGMSFRFVVKINCVDTKTTLIAKALKMIKPDILFRGGDKTLEDMPPEERRVCDELGIKIMHAEYRIDRHGAQM